MSEENGSENGRRKPAGLGPTFDMGGGVSDLFANRKIGVFVKGQKGKTPMAFIIWESVDKCNTEVCPASKGCEYLGFCHDGKCAVQAKYLESVMEIIFKAINGKADELALMEVGFLLIPLFNQLVKLKIQEVGLQGEIVSMTKKGPVIHPILREIRACIMSIKAAMQDLIHKKEINKSVPVPVDGLTAVGDDQDGTPDYYASLRKTSSKPLESRPGMMLKAEQGDAVFTPSQQSKRKIPEKYTKFFYGGKDTHEDKQMMDEEAGQGE